jgi:hypothetical protein
VGRDLALNVAGAWWGEHDGPAVAPERSSLLGAIEALRRGHDDESDWRVDRVGEHKVGEELQQLGSEWHVLHAVPLGWHDGARIDHLVMGPAGVFSLHTRRRPGSDVRVTDRTIRVGARRTGHLHTTRRHGMRASGVLTAACGFDVSVRPVIVFVDLRSFEVRLQPVDVHVTTRKRLLPWLEQLPVTMDMRQIDAVYAAARLSSTWVA